MKHVFERYVDGRLIETTETDDGEPDIRDLEKRIKKLEEKLTK